MWFQNVSFSCAFVCHRTNWSPITAEVYCPWYKMAISASYLYGWQIWHQLKKIIVATFLRLSFQGISAFYLRTIRACSLRTQNFESQRTMLMSTTSMIQGRHTRELWKVNRQFKQLRLWATHVSRKWYQINYALSIHTNSAVWPVPYACA